MKIAASNVTLASTSIASSQREVRESLRMWIGDTRPDFEGKGTARVNAPAPHVSISEAGMTAQSSEAQAIEDAKDAVENDPKMQLIRLLVEFMTGKRITLMRPAEGAPAADVPAAPASTTPTEAAPKKAGFGVEYDYHESYSESSSMSFAASGIIRTEDGKEIKFDLSLQMQHSYSEETDISMRLGDAKKIDPLVINFSGSAAQLTDQRFSFDLNADGKKENIQFVQGGGFLALDRNGDGKINDGKELFGPATGNSFAELQQFDDDGNNWIDENDTAYQQLRVWTKNSAGTDSLMTLKQSNVGALYLGNVGSPFDIKDTNNNLQAQIVSSGVWLSEDGKAGTMQQIDLVA